MTAHSIFNEFTGYLDNEDKESCVRFVLSKLENRQIDIVTLYNQVLTPSLNEPFCIDESGDTCIWKEHIRTSIIHTIIECCYPYVINEKRSLFSDKLKGNVIIACPQEEFHEIGARMVVDFFTLCGYLTTFIGANTPLKEILNAVEHVKPAYVGISVTNYYNLVIARKTIKSVIELRSSLHADYKVIVGGNAFKRNPELFRDMGADDFLDTFNDIKRLTE